MRTDALGKLVIQHLRGSVVPFTLLFEKGRKLTVIYGENGTGKTTICDAFEFLGKGKVGSLDNRGLGKTTRYWHSVGKKATDVAVSLEMGNVTCNGRLAKSDVVVQPPETRPRVEVLRRSQILTLVEATPGDRYTAISRFIDVSGVEASEATLRELIRSLKGSRDTAVARVQENQEAISQYWVAAGRPGVDPIAWAELESARDNSALQQELNALIRLRTSYQRLMDYPQRLQALKQAQDTAEGNAKTALEKFNSCLSSVAAGSEDLISILEAAQSFLAKNPQPAECPLCQSTEKVADLSQQVTQRLQQFAALQTAKHEKTTADNAVKDAKTRISALQDNATQHAADYQSAQAAHTWRDDISVPVSACPTDLTALSTWLVATATFVDLWAKAESKRQEKSQFLAALKTALETYKTNVTAQKDLDLLLPRLDAALAIVAEERRTYTDSILTRIAAEVGRLYEAVHPGEGLNKISLGLDPSKRASLDMNATFCGATDTPPQAYFSQSHLDTLGLCVFLALAALDSPAEIILVLDDVLASIDEPHVERLIEMLYEEALKFRHCIITTHYRPWKQKLRWGWLKTDQCHFVELTKWNNTNGLTLTKSVPDVERLRQLLLESPPDPQLVCSKAGVILEASLDFLTQLYECPVPRRPNALYTLGDLLPSISKKLRQALKVEVFTGKQGDGTPLYRTESLTSILEELLRIAQARNVFGCHFNEISFDLLESDAIGFGEQVLVLMDLLTDPDNGWPRSAKSGSYWATAGETRRLHPLKQPQ